MYAPTACITPTRLPTLLWSLSAALLLLSAFAPAFAACPGAGATFAGKPAATATCTR